MIHPLSRHHCDLNAIFGAAGGSDVFRPWSWISTFDAGEFLNQPNSCVGSFDECKLLCRQPCRVSSLMRGGMGSWYNAYVRCSYVDLRRTARTSGFHISLHFSGTGTNELSVSYTHGVISSRQRSGRKLSASGPQRSIRLWRAWKCMTTKVPLRTKIGDFPSSPPPLGRITSLAAMREVPITTGYNRSAAAIACQHNLKTRRDV
jgi:hypothetical protein